MDNLTTEKTESFLEKLASLGHESPVEHASFTFGIEEVSRALLAQITRHRIASFSVQSQRYVDKTDFTYVIPPEIESDETAKAIFVKAMAQNEQNYETLRDILRKKHYATFIKKKMSEKDARYAAEKKANEDARYVLPNACSTRMIVTMNTRSLYNFFALRCCDRAQWEIRELANEMLRLCKEACPLLFIGCGPACVREKCPEGSMSCGKQAAMRKQWK